MDSIVSLNNSGESLEKTLALYFTSLEGNEQFYSNNNLLIYYGNNLPKKNPRIHSHGTVGFYNQYFEKYNWCPPCSEEALWANRIKIIDKLLFNTVITQRNAEKLVNNRDLFISLISNLPMSFIYPEFIYKIKSNSEIIFSNVTFNFMNLKENFLDVYSLIQTESWRYSIYSLDSNGIVGKYILNIENNQYFERNLKHLNNDLNKKIVLSGNSAVFLTQILNEVFYKDIIIAYREHSREPRPNRNYALNHLLSYCDGIIEPKNIGLNRYFEYVYENYDINNNTELIANIALAKAYENYLNSNVKSLRLR